MILNHLKIAFRNLAKRKGYSLLNMFGLALGITCCLLILQYVAFERSYDRFQEKSGQIVRVRLDSYKENELRWKSATSYPAIAPTMKKDFPEVEDFCRLHDAEMLLTNEARQLKFNETKGYYADPQTLKMFNIKMLTGNDREALNGPDKLVISETMAKKYFGIGEAVGKRLVSKGPDNNTTFEVTGVFKDYPQNSHLNIQYLASYASLAKIQRENGDTSNSTETAWNWYDFYTYLQLRPDADYKNLESKLTTFADKYMNGAEWSVKNKVRNELHLLPLADIHLQSNYNQEAETNGNGQSVSFLFLVSFLIIGIAWINYINLATARSVERAREVGVRKVMGASRFNLIPQFLMESFLLNLFALALALVMVFLLTPLFNQLAGKVSTGGFSLPDTFLWGFTAMFLGGTFLSGIYPAFVLSGYQPITVLKGAFKNTSSGLVLRKGLIITQFATSVILIAGTMIVIQQVKFMRNQELGADISQTLIMEGAGSIQDSLYQHTFEPFKNEALNIPGVKNLAVSTSVMGKEIYWTNGIRALGSSQPGAVTLYHLGVDYDFLPSYGIEIKAGRNFSKEFQTDRRNVLLNEAAVKILGFASPEKAITGKIIRGGDTLSINGVVADFHHLGLQKKVDPMIMLLRPQTRNFYSAKIETTAASQSIASLEKIWNKHFPADPFNYFFLDEYFDQQYKAEAQFGKLFGLFAFLAIIIACFGLLGLSAYNILQRQKEIGIRKVMGASVQQLLVLLSKDFMRLVAFSLIISIPVCWLIMSRWLEDFAYRINISWWVFAAAGIVSVLVALITISLQALKAAFANPVKSLRTE